MLALQAITGACGQIDVKPQRPDLVANATSRLSAGFFFTPFSLGFVFYQGSAFPERYRGGSFRRTTTAP